MWHHCNRGTDIGVSIHRLTAHLACGTTVTEVQILELVSLKYKIDTEPALLFIMEAMQIDSGIKITGTEFYL
jgi:hypothetical protein